MTKEIKKSFLAWIMLFCFSAAVLPLDFFHDHATEQQACETNADKSPCHHKVHISKKASFCFACAFHLDKTFIKTDDLKTITLQTSKATFIESETLRAFAHPIGSYLRGPPLSIEL